MIHDSPQASLQCCQNGEYRSFFVPAHGQPSFMLPLLAHWLGSDVPLTECYHQRADLIDGTRPTMKEDRISTRYAAQKTWVYQVDLDTVSLSIVCSSQIPDKGLTLLSLEQSTLREMSQTFREVTFSLA